MWTTPLQIVLGLAALAALVVLVFVVRGMEVGGVRPGPPRRRSWRRWLVLFALLLVAIVALPRLDLVPTDPDVSPFSFGPAALALAVAGVLLLGRGARGPVVLACTEGPDHGLAPGRVGGHHHLRRGPSGGGSIPSGPVRRLRSGMALTTSPESTTAVAATVGRPRGPHVEGHVRIDRRVGRERRTRVGHLGGLVEQQQRPVVGDPQVRERLDHLDRQPSGGSWGCSSTAVIPDDGGGGRRCTAASSDPMRSLPTPGPSTTCGCGRARGWS